MYVYLYCVSSARQQDTLAIFSSGRQHPSTSSYPWLCYCHWDLWTFCLFLSAHPYASSGRTVNPFEYVCLCVSVSKIAGGVGRSLQNVKKFCELPKALEGHPRLISLLERVFSERNWNAGLLDSQWHRGMRENRLYFLSLLLSTILACAQDEILMV